MNGNAELLNFVYQNSQMGVDTLNQLIEITNDENFKNHLKNELNEYTEIHRLAKKALNDSGCDEKGLSKLEKLRTYLMINIQTLTDKSASHIAEMLITGSTMGIINAIRSIKKYQDANPEYLALMDRLLKFEENNIHQLKAFL